MIETVLAIETSCDDTSVAIVSSDGFVHSVISANQDDQHAPFGGIVPEIAGRNHSLHLLPMIDVALKNWGKPVSSLGGIVVTNRPGLVGSLLVGVSTAKTLAQCWSLPLLGVNHLEGHLLAPFLRDQEFAPPKDFIYPYVGLAISGGHTSLYRIQGLGEYEVLGQTKDDAAGEAFDKFAKMIGLGFPGGARVDKESRGGKVNAFSFPRGLSHEETFDMSFSGLKSASHRLLSGLSDQEILFRRADLCASFQEAVVDALMIKLERAVDHCGYSRVILTGGVSANSRLRQRAQEWANQEGLSLVIPPLRYCTDNAAMIGYVGALRLARGERSSLQLAPSPSSLPNDFHQAQKV